MSSVINKTILLMAYFFVTPLYGLRVVLMNDIADIALNQKVWLELFIQDGEQGIFKNTLQFSVDHPGVHLVAWNSSALPTDYFSSSRKKNLSLYPETFTGCLSLEYTEQDQLLSHNLLADTRLYISCFVMRTNGKTKPVSTMIALGKPHEINLGKPVPPVQNLSQDLEGRIPDLIAVPNLEKDFEHIEHLATVWETFCKNLTKIIFETYFFWWYSLALLLFFAHILKRRFLWLRYVAPLRGALELEWVLFLGFLSASGSLYLISFILTKIYALYAFAGLCCLVMFYVLITPANEDFFFGRLKNLIGIALGSMILPIVLKAYLMQHGL